MKNSGYFLGLFVLVLAYASVGTAAAPSLTFNFSNVVATKTAIETDSYAVNNAGTIAGDYLDAKGVQHGMILAGTKLATVDSKDCEAIVGTGGIAFYGINNKDEAVGWCTDQATHIPIGIEDKIPWVPCCHHTIVYPGATGTEATGINDKGHVVGVYFDSAGLSHGFSKIGSRYTSIDVPSHTNTVAWGINNAGQITVYATNSSGDFDAYLLTGKTFRNIDNPNAKGGLGTIVHTPSNVGDIDGTYYNSAGAEMGWLLHKGKYYDVADPGSTTDTRADGLNDKATLVGRYGAGTGGGGTGFKATYK